MDIISSLLLVSFISETMTEIVKEFFPVKINTTKTKLYISFVISLICCIGMQINIFDLFAANFNIPYVGCIFTALITSRGSNYVHNFLGETSSLK